MLFKNLVSVLATCAAAVSAADLPALEIVGNKFFYSNNGSQFLLKGVAYQQNTANLSSTDNATFVDPLADAKACARDVPYLAALETNVIRVYSLDVTQDHTACMNLLQEAGIYVIADLSTPDLSINRDDPEWTVELYDRYTSVVDAFQNYTNILGFFAGNEVTNAVNNTNASAFVKAAVRDTKAYIKSQGYRLIPVGYSANDDIDIRLELAEYFACGSEDSAADFFGINMYSWCGTSATFKSSGYQNITEQYANLGIPLFFSEYGCNLVQPRKFTDVGTIYSSEMTGVWSGAIVYMYFQEENDYGLVTIGSNDKVTTLPDYSYLSVQIASVSPTLIKSAQAANVTATTCPAIGANWQATTLLPPTPDKSACECMDESLSCVVDGSVSSDDYQSLFEYVCYHIDCSGINANGTSGDYGAYSPCSNQQRLNFVLDLYYKAQGSSSSACDFSGSASLKSASTAGSCASVLSAAGESGMGTVVPASTTKGSGSSGSASGSKASASASGSSTSTKLSGAIASYNLNIKYQVIVVAISMVFGAGLVCL
ncbi:1,3-beta-glucanosyltransferase gas1 [Scheffersomyces spartinae]|uniref:1,3-beta-glucanosyltransferase n=1 Tax=Scheffersomyces spartinae TaxID=45513 RepID=A0A9P7VAR3_9ASCO|nr:1,3-beta-glucanosyltransferase gas1 [Scheffersomyces spartinae]KAG7194528.1 1,3-beta-glucanosyltransferase gas1 [Scheffersomyces spartinae]